MEHWKKVGIEKTRIKESMNKYMILSGIKNKSDRNFWITFLMKEIDSRINQQKVDDFKG